MAAYWPDLDLFFFFSRGAFWTQPAWCPDPIIFGAWRFYESHSCVLATSNVSDHKRFADMDWFVMGWANKNNFKKSIELLLFVSWPRGGQEFFRIPFFWQLFLWWHLSSKSMISFWSELLRNIGVFICWFPVPCSLVAGLQVQQAVRTANKASGKISSHVKRRPRCAP